jgi:tetratricopeptide (TPR) repeat protein
MGRILVVLLLHTATIYGQASGPAAIGNEHFEQARYGEALAAYEQVPQDQRDAAFFNRLGMSYHMLNRLKEAEAAYKEAIRLSPEQGAPRNNLASLYYSQLKFGDAEREFRRAMERSPEDVIMRWNGRAARFARENGRKAREVAEGAVRERPLLIQERQSELLQVHLLVPPKDLETATTHERRGDLFMVRKMYDDAVIEYRRAIAADRYNAIVVNRLGIAYHQSQKLNEAERQYREALKLNPFYIEALNNLGSVEYSRKRYSRAMDQYSKALKIRPESATILQNIGQCLFALERYEEGVRVYQQALAINPKLFEPSAPGAGTLVQTTQRNDPLMNFHLAKIFADQGDTDRAISYLYRAVEEGFKDLAMLKAEPVFMPLAGDERFVKLIETVGAAAVSR